MYGRALDLEVPLAGDALEEDEEVVEDAGEGEAGLAVVDELLTGAAAAEYEYSKSEDEEAAAAAAALPVEIDAAGRALEVDASVGDEDPEDEVE